jgi:hypothetical protein
LTLGCKPEPIFVIGSLLLISNSPKTSVAQKGTLLTKTKEKVEKNAGDNGVTEFGEKVGGIGQSPMKVVENAIIAGYNYTQGNTSNPTQSSSNPQTLQFEKNQRMDFHPVQFLSPSPHKIY